MRRPTYLAMGALMGMVFATTSSADTVTVYGCSTGAAALIKGVTPSAECTFTVNCPNQLLCDVFIRIDVNGTGQVEGVLAQTSNSIPGAPSASCSGNFHCGAAGGVQDLSPEINSIQYRCAANGIALFTDVTCTATARENEP